MYIYTYTYTYTYVSMLVTGAQSAAASAVGTPALTGRKGYAVLSL